ncbi:hypothetical protein LSM04_006556 [Trypanosoma melophagium]|uniref:uncharacterized protein n=1 Tax=Trypanosoma melophagium TaxID=715481 RepID=UPI00351A08F7|nr:hypothetical protein LSM04_006556 [Trypanosoma melophagium]
MHDSTHAVNYTSSRIDTKREQIASLSIQHPKNNNNNNKREENTSISFMKSKRLIDIEGETRGEAIRIPTTTTSNTRTSSVMPTSSSSSSSYIMFGVGESNNDSTVDSLSLRNCLDLFVRLQKNQAEGVILLTSLRQRLFPTSTVSLSHNIDGLKPHVVTLDEVDREVVRLRVLEMKHAGLYPKLIESIQHVMLPYQSFIQQEVKGESINDRTVLLQELCHRVECLREQFIGLAQLQGEAMESLGAQLSKIFTLPRGIKTLYYYPTNRLDEKCNNSDSNNACERHSIPLHDNRYITVLNFLEQLEDVMASKQHIVVRLAMALREIYDTPSSTTSINTSNTMNTMNAMTPNSNMNTTMMSEVGNNDSYIPPVERNERSLGGVSVSLSPVSTLRPSCSAPREGSLLRRLGEGQGPTFNQQSKQEKKELSTGEVRECVYDNLSDSHKTESVIIISGTSPLPNMRDIHTRRCGASVSSVNSTNSMDRTAEEYNKYQEENKEEKEERYLFPEKLPSEESGVSPKSEIPRSPSLRMCTTRYLSPTVVRIYDDDDENNENSENTAPPPLERCLESTIAINSTSDDVKPKEEKKEKENAKEREEGNVEKDNDGRSNIRNNPKSISASPPLSLPRSSIHEVESQEEGEGEGQKKKGKEIEMNGVDTITENTRLRRMLDAKDNLILNMQERMFAAIPLLVDRIESRSTSSNSSARGQSAEERSASLSTSTALQPPSLREFDVLQESLETQLRENNYLRSTLDVLKEEKQRWKRIARELKEDNKIWKDKERATRIRCTQLEDDVIALKKRVLTLEGVLKLQETAGTIGIAGTRSSISQLSSLLPLSSSTGGHTSPHDGPFPHTASNSNNNNNDSNNKKNKKKEMYDVNIDMQSNTNGEISSPGRSRSQTQPPLLQEEIPTITQTSTSLQQKRSQIFAKLAKRMDDRVPSTTTKTTVVVHTQSPPCEDEPEVVIVSPLTEERSVVQSSEHISTAGTQTPPTSVSPIAVSRIDRRLSPEYLSPPPRLTSSSSSSVNPINIDNNKNSGRETTRLSTSDVNRILASARSLLKNVSSARKHYSGKPSKTEGEAHIDSTFSDYHTTSSDESYQTTFTVRGAETTITPEKNRKPVERIRRSISPPNGGVSPCSSVSYSSAKKRVQRLRPLEKNTMTAPVVTPAEKMAQRKGILTTTTKTTRVTPSSSPQPNVKNKKVSSSPQTREPTRARERLMRELREQLCLLQTQHTSVLSQAEQLEKKREQVIAAMQRQSRSSSNTSTDGSIRSRGMQEVSTNTTDMRHNLTSLLNRFDITQKKVLKNEAQLREYVDIVRKQLKTLEDDLL